MPKKIPDHTKVELDPTKRYIFFIPVPTIMPYQERRNEIQKLKAALDEQGIRGVVIAMEHPESVLIAECPHTP